MIRPERFCAVLQRQRGPIHMLPGGMPRQLDSPPRMQDRFEYPPAECKSTKLGGGRPFSKQPSLKLRPLFPPPQSGQLCRTENGKGDAGHQQRIFSAFPLCRNQLLLSHTHQVVEADASSCLSPLNFEVSAKSKRL